MPIQSLYSMINSIKCSSKAFPGKLNFSDSDFGICKKDLKDVLGDTEIQRIKDSLNLLKDSTVYMSRTFESDLMIVRQLFRCLDDLFKLEELADHNKVPDNEVRRDFVTKLGICREGITTIFAKLTKDGYGSLLDKFTRCTKAPKVAEKTNIWIREMSKDPALSEAA